MTNPTHAALHLFAVTHNEFQFAHLVVAADAGEQWAVERVNDAVACAGAACAEAVAEHRPWDDAGLLAVVRATDCTRPDGAIARKFEI